ncbi:MAG TPA: SpoIIE family protein phosphatase [Acidimicrobiales bacterium]|nr:SpoIIE family protein phosphatase [Acidimicrobiales bacterium]
MAEPDSEAAPGDEPHPTQDRMESVVTWVALVWVSGVAIVDEVYGGAFGLIGFLAIGPFIAASFATPRRTALVGLYATVFSLVLSTPPRQYGQLNHLLRVLLLVASSGVAVWISSLRTRGDRQLWSARRATRTERRRRVAAETAQRMQAMARALTTAADPAQVADAVFAALRDELRVDAAIFATTNERGVLRSHRQFGYDSMRHGDDLLVALDPDGAIGDVMRRRVALIAESVSDLAREWPIIEASMRTTRFSSLAVVPLVVSDRAVGVVVVHWLQPRTISKADRSFLFTMTGAAAQAVERARLTVTEFANLERAQQLQHLTSALAAATTPGDVAGAALGAGLRALGAHSAVCRVPLDRGHRSLTCVASSGHPVVLAHRDVGAHETVSGAAFLSGRTVTVTVGAREHLDPDVSNEVDPAATTELNQPLTIVAEPLTGNVGPLGVLVFAFVAQHEPSDPELRFLSTLAGLTAQALERAQLFELERQALRDAESGRERLSLLSDVTKLLSSSLDPTTVIHRTINLVVGRLADACVVEVPGDAGLQRLDVGGELVLDAETSLLIGADDTPYDSDAPAAVAYRTGSPQLAPLTSPLVTELGLGACTALAVPMTANGEVIGVMTFIDGTDRHFQPDDVPLAIEVASRTGVALSNATQYQRERVVAEVLQHAVLPESLPGVDGMHFDAEYRAGAAGTYAGGDWYDLFRLDDERVFFSVGDVMGKGAPAAALMGQVRSALRAYAVTGQSPSEVLSSLDHLFDTLGEDRVVTVVVGLLNPKTGAVRLTNAGHPPPLVVRADGTTSFCAPHSSLLIAAGLGQSARPAHELELAPGDSLVMFSDGLVERRGEAITVGMERLSEVATEVARGGWPTRPAGTLATLLSHAESTDDVVVLFLRYLGVAAEGTNRTELGTGQGGMSTLYLEPVVESTTQARHWVSARLGDLPLEVAECAALLTSELVTNAVLHAATPLSVTLHVLSGRIRVDVADGSPVIPALKEYGPHAATGRGLTLFNTLASSWGVHPVPGGKIVWFELPVDVPVGVGEVSDGTFHFDLIGMAQADRREPDGTSPQMTVDLLGIPVDLLQKASEEYEGLFRELRLMKERADSGIPSAAQLSDRLSVLVSDVGSRFNGFGPGMDENWQDVVDRKVATYDWHLSLPQAAATACEYYSTMLDEADEFSRSAQLLTLPASDTSIAVRRWFLTELVSQLRGQAPTPWVRSRHHADLMQRAT